MRIKILPGHNPFESHTDVQMNMVLPLHKNLINSSIFEKKPGRSPLYRRQWEEDLNNQKASFMYLFVLVQRQSKIAEFMTCKPRRTLFWKPQSHGCVPIFEQPKLYMECWVSSLLGVTSKVTIPMRNKPRENNHITTIAKMPLSQIFVGW